MTQLPILIFFVAFARAVMQTLRSYVGFTNSSMICVISRLNGIDIMEEKHCVSLVEPENAPELATAIIGLLQDKELRKRMGDNGRRYIVEHQSWEKVTERVAEVLDDVRSVRLKNNRRRGGINI